MVPKLSSFPHLIPKKCRSITMPTKYSRLSRSHDKKSGETHKLQRVIPWPPNSTSQTSSSLSPTLKSVSTTTSYKPVVPPKISPAQMDTKKTVPTSHFLPTQVSPQLTPKISSQHQSPIKTNPKQFNTTSSCQSSAPPPLPSPHLPLPVKTLTTTQMSRPSSTITQSMHQTPLPTAKVTHQAPKVPRVVTAQPTNPSPTPTPTTTHHYPMHPLPKQVPTPSESPANTPQQIQKEPTEPADWNIEETIFNISYMDPSLAIHVEAFRSHEIDGKALLLLTSDMMMKYLGLKLGPALKICNIIDKLKGKKHLPIG